MDKGRGGRDNEKGMIEIWPWYAKMTRACNACQDWPAFNFHCNWAALPHFHPFGCFDGAWVQEHKKHAQKKAEKIILMSPNCMVRNDQNMHLEEAAWWTKRKTRTRKGTRKELVRKEGQDAKEKKNETEHWYKLQGWPLPAALLSKNKTPTSYCLFSWEWFAFSFCLAAVSVQLLSARENHAEMLSAAAALSFNWQEK